MPNRTRGITFTSAEIAGTGSEAGTPHGLGRTPSHVVVTLTQKDTTTAVQITEGVHDAVNINVDCPTTASYKIVAMV